MIETKLKKIQQNRLLKRISIEIVILGCLYGIYTLIRNANEGNVAKAFENAKSVISFQEAIWLSWEYEVHSYFLDFEWLIIGANYFYGSLHFIATIFALVYVFIKDENRYPLVRNTIVFSTLIALVGFISYPLMPPRLLPSSHGFVDTLDQYPTFWSFNSEQFAEISNQYAAMPSVHIIWATWVAFALLPYAKNIYLKVLVVSYPLITLFVIVITSNHYFLDAIIGWIILALAYLISTKISQLFNNRKIQKAEDEEALAN